MKIVTFIILLTTFLVADRFEKQGDIVYDKETKLYWQSTPTTKKYNWQNAKEYCSNLSYGGYSDWRLPNIYELMSLTDTDKYNPSITTSFIEIKTDDYYWTSSVSMSDSSNAWLVYFYNGADGWYGKSGNYYVLCARGQ